MNVDLGELLREGIDRAADGGRLSPGLAKRARQRHHRRQVTVRAASAGGTAVAAAAAVLAATAGTGGAARPAGGGRPAQTTAYVVSHTERALTAAERQNLIERVTHTPPRIEPSLMYVAARIPTGHKGNMRPLSSLPIARTTAWRYREWSRVQGFAPSGRLAIDIGPSTAPPAGGSRPPSQVSVVAL